MSINQEVKNIIDTVKYSYRINQRDIADRLGVSNPYLSDVINGRVPFSNKLRSRIYETFSDISSNSDSEAHANSHCAVNGSELVARAIDEIAEQRKLVVKAQEQIDRLITLLENITKQ